MTLIETADGHKVLVDINICQADDYDDDRPDVASQLRDRLERDDEDRLYVDAFLLTHPDEDHCHGLREHFHLGDPDDWSEDDDKIIIREMWSSPIVFRRRSKNHTLCKDAQAWATEARRRVNRYKNGYSRADGENILILGEDIDDKTDGIEEIVIKVDDEIRQINDTWDDGFRGYLLAPIGPSNDDELEDALSKNNSSVIINIALTPENSDAESNFLFGGDAEVAIWERVWDRNKDDTSTLEYDVLIAPHHCSWHSLSYDSWSKRGEDAKVSDKARDALSQHREGALIISSSKKVVNDKNDPPCIRAKREYVDIVGSDNFKCLADLSGPQPYEIEVKTTGPRPKSRSQGNRSSVAAGIGTGAAAGSSTALGSQPFKHGDA